jgi:ribonuclease VapC
MFLDASIIVAVLGRESDWSEQLAAIIAAQGAFYFSPIVRYEATLAIARIKGSSLADAETVFQHFMDELAAEEIDISPAIGRGALSAAQAYGKIVGHKAQLNFGDCFAYAAARSIGVGLLYKGSDFALTDLA